MYELEIDAWEDGVRATCCFEPPLAVADVLWQQAWISLEVDAAPGVGPTIEICCFDWETPEGETTNRCPVYKYSEELRTITDLANGREDQVPPLLRAAVEEFLRRVSDE